MSDFEVIVSFFPLAVYVGVVGIILCRREPTVVSGVLDLLALAAGLVGFIMVGPVKLLFPIGALVAWEEWGGAWVVFTLIFFLYALAALSLAGIVGTKILIYGIPETLFPEVLEEFQRKNEIQRVGNSVLIPKLDLQFAFDVQPWNRCVILRPTSRNQNPAAWMQLERILRETLKDKKSPRSLLGPALLLVSLGMITLVSFHVYAMF